MKEQISNELLQEIRQMQASMGLSASLSEEQIKEITSTLEKVIDKAENNLTNLIEKIN
jgi:uncharacterized protein YneF (UPF0154 family)